MCYVGLWPCNLPDCMWLSHLLVLQLEIDSLEVHLPIYHLKPHPHAARRQKVFGLTGRLLDPPEWFLPVEITCFGWNSKFFVTASSFAGILQKVAFTFHLLSSICSTHSCHSWSFLICTRWIFGSYFGFFPSFGVHHGFVKSSSSLSRAGCMALMLSSMSNTGFSGSVHIMLVGV